MSHRLFTLLAVFGLACGESAPTQPCATECGAHGTCAVVQGRAQCLCASSWAGDTCGACAPGFVSAGGSCAPDPCVPNPCRAPHQGVCVVEGGAASCRCDADAQDRDGDGTCRPSCAEATSGYGPQTCDDSTGEPLFVGPRTCEVEVRYAPGARAVTQVFLRGEWNDFALDTPMVLAADGSFSSRLQLPPGSYAYKLFDAGPSVWFEDPKNPFFRWVGGERNSRLIVPDCEQPYLRLMHQPEVKAGRVTFHVQYVDGASSAGLGPGGVTVTRDGSPISARVERGVVEISDGGLAPGKYAYRLEASDAAGRAAPRLFVPVWVEDAAFDWRDAILYFAMTDRFLDGDPRNDAPVAGVDPKLNWHGGDFAGIRAKIEDGYFESLGVNAIWISSVSQNTTRDWPGDDGRRSTGYHSYWPISTGWRDDAPLPGVQPVEPHFGDLDELRALVAAAHRHGIRVLVDVVANHVHKDSPLAGRAGWFNLPETDCEPSNWAQPITCWFTSYLPDLHYETEEVMDLMIEHAAWLAEETNVDGFRLDAVKHMIDDFTPSLRGRMDQMLRYSGQRFYMVGETFTGEDGAGLLKKYMGPGQLDGQFDFPLYWQVTATLLREERDLKALSGMVKANDAQYGDAIMSTFMGNHDVCRALSHASGAFADMWCTNGKAQGWSQPPAMPTDEGPFRRLRLAWTFLFTSPGVPLIYYGDEIGMEGAGDPDNRKPMRFDAELNDLQRATLAYTRKLGALRRAHPALRRGARVELLSSTDGMVWAYAMQTRDDVVIVALNRGAAARSERLDLSALPLARGAALRDALTGAEVAAAGGAVNVTLEGRGAAVLVPR